MCDFAEFFRLAKNGYKTPYKNRELPLQSYLFFVWQYHYITIFCVCKALMNEKLNFIY